MTRFLFSITIASALLFGCSKTNEQTLSNNSGGNAGGNTGNCDTVNMKYSANVQPIIQAHCYSCHGNGITEGSVSLDSYNKLKQQADNGKLINVITHASGFPAMPKGLPKLSECDINKIRSWIERGTLNN